MSEDVEKKTQLVIHAVHGTWPYGPKKRSEKPWFMEESEFALEVLKNCPARWLAFKWSGTNSFAARNAAIHAFREHLAKSLEEPDTRHIIVAHSHGGTVAVAAAIRLEKTERARIDGIVTMGAPFITLRYTDRSTLSSVKFLVGRIGSSVLLLYFVCVLLAWWLQIPDYFSTGLVFSMVPWFGLLILATKPPFQEYFFPSGPPGAAAFFDLFDRDSQLKRPLAALRVPGDEAGLAIGAAQTLNYMGDLLWYIGDLLWSLTILAGLGRVRRYADWAGATWYRLGLIWLCIIALSGFAIRFWRGIPPIGQELFGNQSATIAINFAIEAVVGLYSLVGYAMLILLLVILITTLVILPGILVLRFAVGREVWGLAGFAEVECESVPSGMKAVVETLHFGAADRAKLAQQGAWRHSFHELSSARRRVAELIEEWASAHGDPLHDIKEGGRVCDLLFELWEERYRSRLTAGGGEALATFQQLYEIVLQGKNQVSESIFRQRFVPLLPQKEQDKIKHVLIDSDYAAILQGYDAIRQRLAELR